MKCKHCKQKISLIDWLFCGGSCYYCYTAEGIILGEKYDEKAELEMKKEAKKIEEHKKYIKE